MNTALRTLLVTALLAGLAGGALVTASCVNPVIDDRIAALGPEVGERGPRHRPGQPCVLCHDNFTIGGTVYATPSSKIPVENVDVVVTDSLGYSLNLSSNCAGNFYAPHESRELAYPLRAEITCTLPDGTTRRSVMGTRIGRDSSCSDCHTGNPSQKSPGRVGCATDMPDPPFETPGNCGGRG